MNCIPAFNQTQIFTAYLLQVIIIKVPESCFRPCLFHMLGLLSVSMNHRLPKQVAERGSHEAFAVTGMSNPWQTKVGPRTELSNRNIMRAPYIIVKFLAATFFKGKMKQVKS